MKKVKITVKRIVFHKDLSEEYFIKLCGSKQIREFKNEQTSNRYPPASASF